MDLKNICFTGKRPDLGKLPQSAKGYGYEKDDKQHFIKRTKENVEKIGELQDMLYAEGTEGVIIILQALDAAGKDSAVKHVMRGVNPQGVHVVSFKQPSSTELAHDYLWRIHRALPERGHIAIFNRSHYEDVLVTRIHHMEQGYRIAKRCLQDSAEQFYGKRYKQICHFEEYLYENSFRCIKIFLNVSKEVQKQRFLERLDLPSKHWKFSQGDLDERKRWTEYHGLYEEVIEKTGTSHSPWYIVPADQKWYTHYLISKIVMETLEACKPEYPKLSAEEKDVFYACKKRLREM